MYQLNGAPLSAETAGGLGKNTQLPPPLSGPDKEESGTIDTSHENMPSSLMTGMDLSKNKTDKPMQLVIKYPPTKFCSTNRSFQSRWYEQFPWLDYSISLYAAFCLATTYTPLHIIKIENQLTNH